MTTNLDKNENNNQLEDWVRNRFKDEIDKSSVRHPVMTLVRTKADEKIQEILKEFFSSEGRIKEEIKSFNEKEFSVFNHEKIQPSFIDKYFLFPSYSVYKKLEKLNKDLQIIEKAKTTIKGFRITKYTIHFTNFIDNQFDNKYLNYLQLKENKADNIKAKKDDLIINQNIKVNKPKIFEPNNFNQANILQDKKQEKNIEIKEKKIGLISNINQLNNIKNPQDENKFIKEIKEEEILNNKKVKKGILQTIKNLFKSDLANNDKNNAANKSIKKIGIAAIQKNEVKTQQNDNVKMEIKNQTMKIDEVPEKTKIDSNDITQSKIEIENIQLKETENTQANKIETIKTYTNVIEELDDKLNTLKEYKKPQEKILEEKKIIEKNLLAKSLEKRPIEEAIKVKENAYCEKNVANKIFLENFESRINIKDLKLNLSSWFYFRFICPETINQLKFYQGLKSKDLFIDKAYREVLDIFEKNLFYEAKLKTKRIANFWRVAFNIKPDYVIDFDLAKNKIIQKKNKLASTNLPSVADKIDIKNAKNLKFAERYSIFYKLFFLAKPVNMSFSKASRLIFLISFGLFANFRFNLYKKNKILFEEQNYIVDKFLQDKYNLPSGNLINNIFYSNENNALSISNKSYEMKSEIFSYEKDNLYMKVIGLEKMLLAYSLNFLNNEIEISPQDSADADLINKEQTKYFFEKNKSAYKILELIDNDFVKLYNDLLDLTITQGYLNVAAKNSLIILYSAYNILFLSALKKRILLKNAFGKTLLFSFFINELAKYLEFFIYVQKYNFASEKLLKDNSEIFGYYFFRENIHNNLTEKNESLL